MSYAFTQQDYSWIVDQLIKCACNHLVKLRKMEPIGEVAHTQSHYNALSMWKYGYSAMQYHTYITAHNYIMLKFLPYHKNKKNVQCTLQYWSFRNKNRVAKKSSYLCKSLLSISKVKMASYKSHWKILTPRVHLPHAVYIKNEWNTMQLSKCTCTYTYRVYSFQEATEFWEIASGSVTFRLLELNCPMI